MEKWLDLGRDNLMKYFLYLTIAFFVVSMTIMMIYSSRKVIVTVAGENAVVEEEEKIILTSTWKIEPKSTSDDQTIRIPFPTGFERADINVVENIMDRTVQVVFKNVKPTFFVYNLPYGDFALVTEALGGTNDNDTYVTVKYDEPCLWDVSISGDEVKLYSQPWIISKKPVVVIDPCYGGNEKGTTVGDVSESDIVLNIAKRVRALAHEKDYVVVLSRSTDIRRDLQNRLELCEWVEADYYVGIKLSADVDDREMFGVSAEYNADFYRNGMENVDFADIMLKNVAKSCSDRAVGLTKATEDDVLLKALEIPAMSLNAGYMTNSNELFLLCDEEYIEKIAVGIVAAIDEVMDEK